jgi:hypothetical protein
MTATTTTPAIAYAHLVIAQNRGTGYGQTTPRPSANGISGVTAGAIIQAVHFGEMTAVQERNGHPAFADYYRDCLRVMRQAIHGKGVMDAGDAAACFEMGYQSVITLPR